MDGATDLVRLVALYMIREDRNNERKRYNQKIPRCIVDYGNTSNYAVDKLVQWGYVVSIVDDSVEFSENCTRVWGRVGSCRCV